MFVGNCIYCGKPAGFLRRRHRECEERHRNAWNEMVLRAKKAALGIYQVNKYLEEELHDLAKEGYVSQDKIKEALILGWEEAVLHFLEDGNLDAREENKLVAYAEYFKFTQDDLNKRGIYTRFVQGAVLREVLEGKIPQRFKTVDPLPFNFQKSESLVWAFSNVKYYEKRTRREYVGGSHGVSIRIAKGVYYRVGQFKGYPIEREEQVYVDTGILAVTTKHLYFYGKTKSFRVPYSKIVSFTPYSDGIGIQRDATSAKPQTFVTGDGWFIYNLVVNLAREQVN